MGPSPLRFVRRSEHWLDAIASAPIAVPQALLDIPGIRYVEPEEGHPDPIWKVEVPSTAWMLPTVREAIPPMYYDDLGPAAYVPEWPSLYEHQQEALGFLVQKRGGLLAMELGLGKTRPAAIAARLLANRAFRFPTMEGARPVLIVGPKYLYETWVRETKLALGESTTICALSGVNPPKSTARAIPLTDFIFVHYEIVHAWWSQITMTRPGCVIFEEAHTIRNARTRRGKAAALAASVAPYRIAITGTPMLNRPQEILSLLEMITGKWTWGTPSRFRERYAGAVRDTFGLRDGKPTNTDEFRQRLSGCTFRKSVDDIGIELPPVQREVIYVDMTDEEKKAYADLFDGYSVSEVVEAILEHRASEKTFPWLSKLRKISSDAKRKTACDILNSLREEDESSVLFCWRRETAEYFCGVERKEVAKWHMKIDVPAFPYKNDYAYCVHGGISQKNRDLQLAAFADSGGLLTATYDALATGVTLDRARIVLLYDLDWVPATMLQGAGRVTGGLRRKGRNTIEKWLVARGTLDELVLRLVGLKGTAIEQLTADRAAAELSAFLGYKEKEATLEKIVAWARSV